MNHIENFRSHWRYRMNGPPSGYTEPCHAMHVGSGMDVSAGPKSILAAAGDKTSAEKKTRRRTGLGYGEGVSMDWGQNKPGA